MDERAGFATRRPAREDRCCATCSRPTTTTAACSSRSPRRACRSLIASSSASCAFAALARRCGAPPRRRRRAALAGPCALRPDAAAPIRGTSVLEGTEEIRFTNTGPPPSTMSGCASGPTDRAAARDRRPASRCRRAAREGATAAGCTALRIDLDSAARPGGGGRRSASRSHVDAPRANDRFGRSGGALLLGNAIPVLAVGGRRPGRGWCPTARRRELLLADGGVAPRARRAGRRRGRCDRHGDRAARAPARWRLAHRQRDPAARDLAIAVGPFGRARCRSATSRCGCCGCAREAGGRRAAAAAGPAGGAAYSRWYGRLGARARRAGRAGRRRDAVRRVRRHGVPGARDGRRRPDVRRARGRAPVVLRARGLRRVARAVAGREASRPSRSGARGHLAACQVRRPLAAWPRPRLTTTMAVFERRPERTAPSTTAARARCRRCAAPGASAVRRGSCATGSHQRSASRRPQISPVWSAGSHPLGSRSSAGWSAAGWTSRQPRSDTSDSRVDLSLPESPVEHDGRIHLHGRRMVTRAAPPPARTGSARRLPGDGCSGRVPKPLGLRLPRPERQRSAWQRREPDRQRARQPA